MPRTQRSAPSAVRCRAGAHAAAWCAAFWVPALRRTADAPRPVRDTRAMNEPMTECESGVAFSIETHSQTRLHILAAAFARALQSSCPPEDQEGAGKAGRRLAPEVPRVRKKRARGGRQVMPVARPSLRDGFHGVLRALLGERCTIAPVALRLQMRAPVGRHITARLDARTSGAGTTRLLRPRTSSLGSPRLACAHRRDHAKTLSAPCRIAPEAAHGSSRPAAPSRADAVAATAFHPAFRDDRDPPSCGMEQNGNIMA